MTDRQISDDEKVAALCRRIGELRACIIMQDGSIKHLIKTNHQLRTANALLQVELDEAELDRELRFQSLYKPSPERNGFFPGEV